MFENATDATVLILVAGTGGTVFGGAVFNEELYREKLSIFLINYI